MALIREFLCDLLVYDSYDDIPNSEKYFTPQGLSYQQLFADPRLHEILRVNHVFEQFVGSVCPWPIMYDIMNHSKSLQTTTFLQFLPGNASIMQDYQNAERESENFVSSLRKDIVLVMSNCKAYLSKRWVLDPQLDRNGTSLFKLFCSRQCYVYPKTSVSTGVLDRETLDNYSHGFSAYDYYVSQIMSDFYLQRLVLEGDVVFLHDTLLDHNHAIMKELIVTILNNIKSKKLIVASGDMHAWLRQHLNVNYTSIVTNEFVPSNVVIKLSPNEVHYVSGELQNIYAHEKSLEKCISKHMSYLLYDRAHVDDVKPGIIIVVQSLDESYIRGVASKHPENFILPLCQFGLSEPYLKMILDSLRTKSNRRLYLKSLVYKSLLVRLASSLETLKHCNQLSHLSNRNCVTLIDNRSNPLSLMSILISMGSLHDPMAWSIVIVTSESNVQYYENEIRERFYGHTIVTTYNLLDWKHFDIDTYNIVLKSSDFWSLYKNYSKCLLVQDDGILINHGVEDFLQYDYVGSPWYVCPENAELQSLCPGMVGNGGLSLRDVDKMIGVTSTFVKEKDRPFNRSLQPIPEDVYFSKYVVELGGTIPDSTTAKAFAFEQVFNMNACGIHKCWAYCSEYDLFSLCEKLCIPNPTPRRRASQ